MSSLSGATAPEALPSVSNAASAPSDGDGIAEAAPGADIRVMSSATTCSLRSAPYDPRNIGTTSGWTARAEPAYAPGSVLSLMFAEA